MIQSLMQGLNERDMQAVVNSYNLTPFYWPTLFPLKQNLTLTWKALERKAGLRIAADIVARGSKLTAKTRQAIAKLTGDIPKVAIKREKDEDELNEYDLMVALASDDANLKALVEAWAEDTQFCWDGVASRLEWIALQTMSLGKVTLTNENNVGPLSEFDVDYEMGERKLGYFAGSNTWDNVAAKPISKDFRGVTTAARKKGVNLKYAFMNTNTFAKFAEIEEVKKISASYVQNVLGATFTPTVDAVNTALKTLAYLHGLEIRVIDQNITVELSNGEEHTGNPFADDVVMFSESLVQGQTFWTVPTDFKREGTPAIKVMNGPILIKKFAEEEPIKEVTIGTANAFPAWLASGNSYLLDVTHDAWSK